MLTATFKAVALAAALVVCAVAAPAQTSPTQFFGNHGVWLSIAARSTTTRQVVTATWGQASDGRLTAERYYVTSIVTSLGISTAKVDTQVALSRAFDIPLPVFSGDSARLRVVVRAGRKGVIGTDSVWGERWFRRQQTAADIAHADSFPKANHRITLCSLYGQRLTDPEIATALAMNLAKLTTLADSARERNEWEAIRTGVDSLYTPQDTSGIRIFKGYRYPIAVLIKNRYTGAVRAEGGVQWSTPNPEIIGLDDGEADCTAKAAAWQAERSGD